MKNRYVIAALVGLALGFVARYFTTPSESSADEMEPVVTESSPSRSHTGSDDIAALSWGLSGTLSSGEILSLPLGSRRTAEFTLWSLTATSAELADYWDRVVAEEGKNRWVLNHIVTAWVRRFPEESLAHLGGSREEFLYWWALGRIDPEAALDQVDQSNSKMLTQVIKGIGANDPDLALTLVNSSKNVATFEVLLSAIDGLMEGDPARAIELMANHEIQEWRYLDQWLQREPERAFSWILENRQLATNSQNSPFKNTIAILMEMDPAMVAKKISELPIGQTKSDLLAGQVGYLAKDNLPGAVALAQAETGLTQQKMFYEIIATLSRSDPAKALEVFRENQIQSDRDYSARSTQLPDQRISRAYYNPGKSSWDAVAPLLRHDPEAVMDVALEHPGRGGSQILPAFTTWAALDQERALDWLEGHSDLPAREIMLNNVLRNLHYHKPDDFEQVLRLSATLKNEREKSDQRIISQWFQEAPGKARKFFQSGKGTTDQQDLANQLMNEE